MSQPPANDASLRAIIVSFAVNFSISAILFTGFCILRPRNKAVYEPKLKYAPDAKKPDPIPDSFLDWIRPILKVDEVEKVGKNGVDATMFLRFVGMGSRFFGLMTVISFPLMIVHFYAKTLDQSTTKIDNDVFRASLNVLTIENVDAGSNIFYLHAFFAYVISLYAYYLFYKTWFEYIELRKFYFSGSDYLKSFRNRVLLFTNNDHTNLPDFQRYLATLDLRYPPEQVLLGRDYSNLSKLVAKHYELTCNYEKVLNKYLKDPNHVRSSRPTHKENAHLGIFGGEEVDSIDFYRQNLLEIEEQIYKDRAKRDEDFLPDSSVFVAFGDIVQAHTNARKIIHPFSSNALYQLFNPHPNIKICPDFEDIIWDNIGIAPNVKRTRKLIATGLLVALTIGWVFINSLLAGLSNSVNFSFLPRELSGLGVFLQSILVPLLTAILNILLPIILRYIARMQGVVSESGVERSALIKFFVFQVYQFFIQIGFAVITVFAKKFFNGTLRSSDFESLLKELTANAVTSSIFFVTYIASGITFYGVEIIQGVPLITTIVKKRFFNSTPREEYQLSEAPKFNYMVIYGFLLMAFLTGTCYSLIAPIIVPFCAITFSAAYLTMKYQLFYVYETEHESGGIWWPKIFNLLCFTIGLFQATVFGSLVLKTISRTSASRYPNLIVSPLPFLTVAFWVYCVFVIEPKSSFLSKDLQVSIPDHQREARFETDVLKNRVYNPAVIKLLPKVWVRNDLIPFLSQYYQPKYKDVIDFVRKTNPARLGETKDMENVRRQQRHSLSRSHSKRLRPLSATVASLGLAEQQPLSPELMDGPPEEMTDDISDVPLQVFGDTRSGYQNQYSPTSSPSGSSQQLVRPDVLLLREGSVSSGSTPTSAGQGYSNAYQQRYPDHPRRPSDPSQRQYSDRPSDLYDPNYQRPSETRNERPQLPQRYPQQNGLNGQESRYNPRYDPRYDPSYDPRNQRNY